MNCKLNSKSINRKLVDSADTEQGKAFYTGFVRSGTVENWEKDKNPIWEEVFQWMRKHLDGTDIPLTCSHK